MLCLGAVGLTYIPFFFPWIFIVTNSVQGPRTAVRVTWNEISYLELFTVFNSQWWLNTFALELGVKWRVQKNLDIPIALNP